MANRRYLTSAGLTPSRPPKKKHPPRHFQDGSIRWPASKPTLTLHYHDKPRNAREREVREERKRLRRERERAAREAPSGSGAKYA